MSWDSQKDESVGHCSAGTPCTINYKRDRKDHTFVVNRTPGKITHSTQKKGQMLSSFYRSKEILVEFLIDVR